MSGGFIEHFDDAGIVLAKHFYLLKKGGIMIITIPNFQGINYYLSHFFQRDIEKTCNFNIMDKDNFFKIFQREDLKTIHCNYFGTLYLPLNMLDNGENGRFKIMIYRALVRFQILLNYIFHILFKEKGAENKYFSPYLIYIGQKL